MGEPYAECRENPEIGHHGPSISVAKTWAKWVGQKYLLAETTLKVAISPPPTR